MKRFRPVLSFSPAVSALAAAWLLLACAGTLPGARAPEAITAEALSPQAREHRLWIVSADHQLQRVRAGSPDRIEQQVALRGLAAGDEVVGIDFRVARGVLYLLTRQGRLHTVDTASGQLTPVGAGALLAIALPSGPIGFDFNPVADRIRIVGGAVNLRVHPDTGAMVDGDPKMEGLQPDGALRYAEGDPARGRTPRIDAAGYTYNKTSDKLTTNYAIDQAAGTLVMQGSLEGATPAVSPNTGLLSTVGPLGVKDFSDAAFDIADIDNTALAALRTDRTRLYRVDLKSGQAQRIGPIGTGAPIRGLAIEP
ncbi:MAG: hypothetical protein RL654_1968 [Pseudomonadota bacterium]|jgi:hypothetical protein